MASSPDHNKELEDEDVDLDDAQQHGNFLRQLAKIEGETR